MTLEEKLKEAVEDYINNKVDFNITAFQNTEVPALIDLANDSFEAGYRCAIKEIDEACKKAKIEECEYWREIIFSPEQQAIKPTISLTDFQLRIVELSPKESE